jgi:GDP-4-dehydro-6-deoxy-D-mannose reductase
MIFYNGSTGSLGFYFAGALERQGLRGFALRSRLGDAEGTLRELRHAGATAEEGDTALVQMAARVSVPECERDPEAAFRTNVEQTAATAGVFLDWAASRGLRPRVVYVSTGHVYAAQPQAKRATEVDPTAPRSVYARTKLQAESTLRMLCAERQAPLWIARVFGLLAPRQPPHYVLPSLIRRAREGSLRGIPGLDFRRDYLDARDVCDCLVHLALALPPSPATVLNVCSGRPVAIRDLLAEIAAALQPGREAELLQQATAAEGRPDDVPWIVGDPARFVALVGRDPQQRTLHRTVSDAVHGA